jgi:hypothetical protein
MTDPIRPRARARAHIRQARACAALLPALLPVLLAMAPHACAAAGQAATPAATPALAANTDWSALARRDVEFAGAALKSMHVGAAAGLPSVTVPLDTGLRAALAEAPGVRSQQDYRRVMQRFIAGFGDPHTGINLKLEPGAWTGLIVDLPDARAGRYRVAWSEPGWPTPLPPKGAEVQSCDGIWFGTYLQTALAPFWNRSVEYAGTYAFLAQQAMVETGLGWTPQSCIFVLPDGGRKTYALPLQTLADSAARNHVIDARRTVYAEALPVGLSSIGAGKHWVGMPDFNGGKSGAAYAALYPRLASLPKSGWVVFDLRGNGGGDSSLGNRALAALFGTPFADRAAQAGGAEEYMVADANTVAVLKRYAATPEYAASKDQFEASLDKVEAAIARGEKLALVDGEAGAADQPLAPLVRPHGPRIAALIDRTCFSSCMNFLQQIRAIGDSVVLGEPTLGYSPFGEISSVALPSGQGKLRIPTAWFKTAQATREPFLPDLAYAGNLADDAAVQRWVGATLDRIDAGHVAGIKGSELKATSGNRGSRH